MLCFVLIVGVMLLMHRWIVGKIETSSRHWSMNKSFWYTKANLISWKFRNLFMAEPNILCPWASIWSTLGTHVNQMGTHGHTMFGFGPRQHFALYHICCMSIIISIDCMCGVVPTIHDNFLSVSSKCMWKDFPEFESCFVSFRPKCPL